VDFLKAPNGRTVKADPVLKKFLRQFSDGDAEVLPSAGQIRKAQVHDLHPGFFRHADDILR
jgi:hypothetical protein